MPDLTELAAAEEEALTEAANRCAEWGKAQTVTRAGYTPRQWLAACHDAALEAMGTYRIAVERRVRAEDYDALTREYNRGETGSASNLTSVTTDPPPSRSGAVSGAKPTMTAAEEALWERQVQAGRLFDVRDGGRVCECGHTRAAGHRIRRNTRQVSSQGGRYRCWSCECLEYHEAAS